MARCRVGAVAALAMSLVVGAAPARASHVNVAGTADDAVFNPQVPLSGVSVNDAVFVQDGEFAFVSVDWEASGEVAVFALPEWDLVDAIDVGGRPFGLDVAHDGRVLVAVDGPAEVVEVDPRTRAVVGRVELDSLFRYNDLRDVMEVDDGVVLVTSARDDPVRYERDDPSGSTSIRGYSGAGWSIVGDRGAGFVYLTAIRTGARRVDTTDPAFPRDGVIDDDRVGDARWAPFDPGREVFYSGTGAVVSTDTRGVVGTLGHGTHAISADGSEIYQFSIDHLPVASEAALSVYNADTLDLIRTFSPSCYEFGVFIAVHSMQVDPSGDNLVLIGDEGLCLEPLDGSGAPTAFVNLTPQAVDSDRGVAAQFALFDSQDRLVFETDSRTEFTDTLRLLPGEYSILVFDALRDDGWPYLPGWHDQTPLLSRDVVSSLRIRGDGPVEVPVDPFFYDIVDTSQTFWDSMWWLRLTGITNGCGPTTYCPEDFVTRGQMAAFLDRALDLPQGGPSGFVDDGGTFRQNIWNLKAAGITTGCVSDRFCTDDFVTRAQMALFLERALSDNWPDVGATES